ncbi:MAG: AAA family ATPase [Acidobacteria bacterium]|nr:AAA family ATPase [Acidobacteriota bacterium]
MTNDQSRLVLVVDSDQRFIDDARPLFAAHRILSGRDLDEAREIVLGGRVDLVLLGPAFGSDVAISQARELLELVPGLQMALAADVVTNRLLKAALKGGLVDVLETPLAERDVAELIERLSAPAPIVDVIVEPAPSTEHPTPNSVEESVPAPAEVESPPFPHPAATMAIESPDSVSTPTEVTFVAEGAPPRLSEAVAELPPETLGAAAAAATMPEVAGHPVVPQPRPEDSPMWTEETEPADTPQPAPMALDPLPPEVAEPPMTPDSEALAPFTPPPLVPVDAVAQDGTPFPPTDSSSPVPSTEALDILERVMPAPPTMPPPGTPEEHRATPSMVERSGPGRVIAIMAGKGGSGKTVTAVNLAIAIGLRADPERVAIVDADLQFGDVALVLQIDPVRTLDDVVDQIDQISDEKLEAALLRHESGIRVLPAPLLPTRAGEIEAKSVVTVVDRLRSMFDTVIVDTGPVFDDGLVMLLEHADQVIAVVDMDLPSVKNAKVVLDSLRQLGFDMDRIRLVVNRANSKARLDLVEIERSLGLRVGGEIPSDRLVPQSVNEGIPVLALSPRSKVARAFHALAESMDADATPERLDAH